jgi:DNA-binding MarR family transcriptional regulator
MKNNTISQFIIIPYLYLVDENLSLTELAVLAIIYNTEDKRLLTNKYIGKRTKVGIRRVQQVLASLTDKNYIGIIRIEGTHKRIIDLTAEQYKKLSLRKEEDND